MSKKRKITNGGNANVVCARLSTPAAMDALKQEAKALGIKHSTHARNLIERSLKQRWEIEA